MPDARFFGTRSPFTLADAAEAAGFALPADKAGAGLKRAASPLESDLAGAVVYCADKASVEKLNGRNFALCLTSEALAGMLNGDGAIVAVKSPKLAFARVTERLHYSIEDDAPDEAGGKAVISPEADVHPSAVLGPDVEIGAGARIGPHCHIGRGVIIGEGTHLAAGVAVTHAVIGKRVRILPGAKIGQAGFGFVEGEGGLVRVPQLGRVLIGDDVEVGANSTIDRGALGDTVIGDGAKIDNLVQIGHNVRLGRNSVLAAQTGISGSCVIGDGVMMGGQVGLADHLTIGDGAQLAAQAGLMRDVPAGEKWGGTPARRARDWLRETAALAKLANKKTGK